MIYDLRKKFIKICSLSFLAVLVIIMTAIFINNEVRQNRMLDMIADAISENDGAFPKRNTPAFHHLEQRQSMPNFINAETPFTTRFFQVHYDANGNLKAADTAFISGISQEDAQSYAETVLQKSRNRGWYHDYRYKVYEKNGETSVLFINGSMFRSTTGTYLFSSMSVFVIGSLAVLLLIIIISKKAVKPVAESYEKQKQFVTDANHELKTPLTLILANVDIAESEVGQNEWLSDIRSEGQRMSVLVNQLVTLSRMDEYKENSDFKDFCISDCVADTVSEFTELAEMKGKRLISNISEHIHIHGDEAQIRQLTSILLDNAVKYCDENGVIEVSLKKERRPVLLVKNTYRDVDLLQLDKLFDRFYRADQARTAGSGFGVGLSIAQSIAGRHHGGIKAEKGAEGEICFKVKLHN